MMLEGGGVGLFNRLNMGLGYRFLGLIIVDEDGCGREYRWLHFEDWDMDQDLGFRIDYQG